MTRLVQVTCSVRCGEAVNFWRVGGVGSPFVCFTVGHYLNDTHSLCSVNFAQQAAIGHYFTISTSHWKANGAGASFLKTFWLRRASWLRIYWQEKQSHWEEKSCGFPAPGPTKLCREKAPDTLAQSKLDETPLLFRPERRDRNFLVRGVWRMASQFHQLRILVWKNWLGVKRQPVRSFLLLFCLKWECGVHEAILQAILKCDVNER